MKTFFLLLISDSSSSDSSSSSSSDEDDSDGEEEDEGSKPKGPQNKKKSKAEFSIHDLPPIEDLHITVPEHECVELGQVWMLTKLFICLLFLDENTPPHCGKQRTIDSKLTS